MGGGLGVPRILVRRKRRKPRPPKYYLWLFFALWMFTAAVSRVMEGLQGTDSPHNFVLAGGNLLYGILGWRWKREADPNDEDYVLNMGNDLAVLLGGLSLTFTSLFV